MKSNSQDQGDPLIRVFPRMTKCNFHKYGYSGSIETHDAMCFLTCKFSPTTVRWSAIICRVELLSPFHERLIFILIPTLSSNPVNIVNEKIYVVLWFWFAFLFVVTSLGLLNRIMLVLFPKYRYRKLEKVAPSTDKKYLKHLTSRVGNWFILHQICIHMKPSHFRDLMDFLVKEHFDKNCNLVIGNNKVDQMNLNNKMNPLGMIGMPMNNNKMMMAPSGQMMVNVPSAPMAMNTGSKKKSSKSAMKNSSSYYGRSSGGKTAGFVAVNRDPPSGLSNSESGEDAINLEHY